MNSPPDPPPQTVLVTGPARCGKSEWAETLAQRLADQHHQQVIYLATAKDYPEDSEWQQRIQQHRQRRPSHWQTREVPFALAATIALGQPEQCFLIDSLGTWVANSLDKPSADWDVQVEQLLKTIPTCRSNIILVAEETGWGVVPVIASGRLFRDRLGALTCRVGAIASTVYLVTGGYALNLSQLGIPLPGDAAASNDLS